MSRLVASSVCILVALLVGCSSSSAAPRSSASAADSGQPGAHVGHDAGNPGTRTGDDASRPGTPIAHDSGSRQVPVPSDASNDGAATPATDAVADSGLAGDAGGACEWGGAPGTCMTLTACAAIADHTSYANECPGPASIECCIVTPNTADNPPTPAGYELMQQSQVTSAMTTWAVAILDDPVTYPMFSTATQTFGTQLVLARVEWHPPDFQNSVVHRGVTLYVPI
jgi:hypothetical protein